MSLQALWVRSMRTGVRLAQDRDTVASAAGRSSSSRAHAQRLVGRVADAEHPLVAAHRAHAAPHLVGQRLEAQAMIGLGQRAGQPLAGSLRRLGLEKDLDRFLEAAQQEQAIALERHQPTPLHRGLLWQMEAMDGVEKERGPHALVQVVAGTAQRIQLDALGQQLGQGGRAAALIERAVAHAGVRRSDDVGQ